MHLNINKFYIPNTLSKKPDTYNQTGFRGRIPNNMLEVKGMQTGAKI